MPFPTLGEAGWGQISAAGWCANSQKPQQGVTWWLPAPLAPQTHAYGSQPQIDHRAKVVNAGDEDLFWRYGQLYAFARLICCRARKTVRSPAFTSDDTVHSRKATLRESMRSADQKVSSPIRCCFAWQAVQRGTA